MAEEIFREKSLKKITSSEDLNDYVKVASPGVWLILVAVIALLVGLLIWGIFGRIDTTIYCSGKVNNGIATVYVKEEDIDKVDDKTLIHIGKDYWSIREDLIGVNEEPMRISEEDFSEKALHFGDLEVGDWVYKVEFRIVNRENKEIVTDGIYSIGLIVEKFRPISLLFN